MYVCMYVCSMYVVTCPKIIIVVVAGTTMDE